MKKILSLVTMLFIGFVSSQQVTIGSGTRVDSNVGLSTPISIFYGYTLSQQIYLASEIGGPMMIQQLKFYTKATPTTLSNTAQIDVWIGHTSLTGFANVVSTTGAAWIPVAQQTKSLSSGTATFSGNEITLTLDTPFAYNGVQNLVITVDENKSGSNGNALPFYQTIDYSTDQTLINRSDTINPDPANPPTNYTGPSSTATVEVQGKKYKAILTLIFQNLGIKEATTIGDASIFPNPSSDFINFKTKLNIISVDIFDYSGRKINSALVKDNQLVVRNLAKGEYLLKINYKEGITSTKKFIKN